MFRSSKAATSSPPSLTKLEIISKQDWMKEHNVDKITKDTLYSAIYTPTYRQLQARDPTNPDGMGLISRPLALETTLAKDMSVERRGADTPCFARYTAIWSLITQPYTEEAHVKARDNRFPAMRILGGSIDMNGTGKPYMNIVSYEPDDEFSKEPQTGKIICGFTEEEYDEFWADVKENVNRRDLYIHKDQYNKDVLNSHGLPVGPTSLPLSIFPSLSAVRQKITTQMLITPPPPLDDGSHNDNVTSSGPSQYPHDDEDR
jgi:hypothetical protein